MGRPGEQPFRGDSNNESGGSWSPDGSQFVYLDSESMLMTVKTSVNATPRVLKKEVDGLCLPDWSPTGEWII